MTGPAKPTSAPPPTGEGTSPDARTSDGEGLSGEPSAPPRPPAPPGQPATATAAAEPVLPPPDSPFAPVPDSTRESLDLERARGVPPPSGIFRLTRILQAAPPKPPPEPLLQVEGLTKRFGSREVVRGVDLEVGVGEIVGLLGRNGAGKTTSFRMIMGMLKPDAGKVIFDYRDITRLAMYARANRGLGYLAQEPSVFQRMNVEDNLMAVLELQMPDRQKRDRRLLELVRKLGLETVRKSRADTLSGGERRRLEIARAMTLKPKVILFDEPFAGIDPIAVTEIQGILRDLKADGIGVLLTDHNVRETLAITDRTYIMDEGVIWIHGSPREIVDHPEARRRYLGNEFRFDF